MAATPSPAMAPAASSTTEASRRSGLSRNRTTGPSPLAGGLPYVPAIDIIRRSPSIRSGRGPGNHPSGPAAGSGNWPSRRGDHATVQGLPSET